jgi:hypothetical protein
MSFSVMFKRDRIRISFRANGLDLEHPDAFFGCDEFEGRRFWIAGLAYPREERFEVLIGVDYLSVLHRDVAVAELLTSYAVLFESSEVSPSGSHSYPPSDSPAGQ